MSIFEEVQFSGLERVSPGCLQFTLDAAERLLQAKACLGELLPRVDLGVLCYEEEARALTS